MARLALVKQVLLLLGVVCLISNVIRPATAKAAEESAASIQGGERNGDGSAESVDDDARSCPNNCSNQGLCTQQRECLCLDGFAGADCSMTVCPAACHLHGSCSGGKCKCNPGFSGYDCSYRGCEKNCSGHGACSLEKKGPAKCLCFAGWEGAACEKKSVRESACKQNCSDKGLCLNGVCQCEAGYTGAFCQEKVCEHGCYGRGLCDTKTGTCLCLDTQKYAGKNCEITQCPHKCYGHGKCSKTTGKCLCDKGFYGPDCNPENCKDNCNNNGKCQTFAKKQPECKCNPFYGGETCSVRQCPLNCSGKGKCDTSTYTCKCSKGYFGLGCDQKICVDKCLHGKCSNGKCVCETDWSGKQCDVKLKCPNKCSGGGLCKHGKCYCEPNRTGLDCGEVTVKGKDGKPEKKFPKGFKLPTAVGTPGQRQCTPACGMGGQCVYFQGAPRCLCKSGWWGKTCAAQGDKPTFPNAAAVRALQAEKVATKSATPLTKDKKKDKKTSKNEPKCETNCGVHGVCLDLSHKIAGVPARCYCDQGFYGLDCSMSEKTKKKGTKTSKKRASKKALLETSFESASSPERSLVELETEATADVEQQTQQTQTQGQFVRFDENGKPYVVPLEKMSAQEMSALDQLKAIQDKVAAEEHLIEQQPDGVAPPHAALIEQQQKQKQQQPQQQQQQQQQQQHSSADLELLEEERQRQLEEEQREDEQLIDALDKLTGSE